MSFTTDYPPRNGRSICHYLSDEEQGIAMRVFIDVSLRWYAGVEPYFLSARNLERTEKVTRSWVVCFEDFTNASNQRRLFDESIDFLFPGDAPGNIQLPVQPGAYDGGHATSHDPSTRQVLLDLVHELDQTVFNNTLRRLNMLYDCGNH